MYDKRGREILKTESASASSSGLQARLPVIDAVEIDGVIICYILYGGDRGRERDRKRERREQVDWTSSELRRREMKSLFLSLDF